MAEAYPSTTNLSDENPYRCCDPCTHRGLSTQAESHCTNCSENLCNTCESVHRSSKATRNHELKPLNESQKLSLQQRVLVSSVMKCEVHHAESFTSFCVSHDLPICPLCSSTTHRKCNKMLLGQISNEARAQMDVCQCIEKANNLMEDIKCLKEYRQKDKTLIENSSINCLQEVKRLNGQIIEWAERLANDMEDQINQTKAKLLDEIQENMDAMANMEKTIQGTIQSFDTLGKGLEEAAFVLMRKERKNIEDSNEIAKDIAKNAKSVTMEFEVCDKLTKIMPKNTIGKLGVKEKQTRQPGASPLPEHEVCFQNTTVTNKNIIGEYNVTGCTCMPDGKLVICDNVSVKVFTKDLKLNSELKLEAFVCDVTSRSGNEIILTQPFACRLLVLAISETIERKRSIPVGMNCWGIECRNDKLYVCLHGVFGNRGVVKVLTMEGVSLNTFTISVGKPWYLAVNSSGDRILVSTGQRVECLDNTGHILFTYRDCQLGESRGVLLDSDDNFMVCGKQSNSIHVVNRDGVKQHILLSTQDGLYGPNCLTYRESDKTLFVGRWSLMSTYGPLFSKPPKLLSYTIK